MSKRLKTDGNSFIVEDTGGGVEIEVAAVDLRVKLISSSAIAFYEKNGKDKYIPIGNDCYERADCVNGDDSDSAFATIEDLTTYIRKIAGKFSPGASGTTLNTINFDNNLSPLDDTVQKAFETLDDFSILGGGTIEQQVNQFSDLVAGTAIGNLAYVENSEGTKWLPGTMGGTYYPSGWYLWTGSSWVSDRNDIAIDMKGVMEDNDDGVAYLFGDEDTDGSWRLKYLEGTGGLCMQVRQVGTWVSKGDWTNSYMADKFILNNASGRYGFYTDAGHYHNLVRPSYTDKKGFVLGTMMGEAIIFSNSGDIIHKYAEGSDTSETIFDGVVEMPFTAWVPFEDTIQFSDNVVQKSISIYPKTVLAGTKYRIEIKDQLSGVVVYENCSEYNHKNWSAGLELVEGIENVLIFNPNLSIIKDRIYEYSETYSEDVIMYGDGIGIKTKITSQTVKLHNVATYHKFLEYNTYNTGDKVWYNETVMFAKEDGITGVWDDSKWTDSLIPHDSDKIISPDGLKNLTITDTVLKYNDGANDRLDINSIDTKLWNPSGSAYLELDSSNRLIYSEGNDQLLKIGGTQTKMASGNNEWQFILSSGYMKFHNKSNLQDRVLADNTLTVLYSPNGLKNITVDDTGAFYHNSEILTNSDRGSSEGVAPLVGGLVPEANLPAYVDDVLEKYLDIGDTKGNGYDAFYDEIELITKVTEATGVIYIDLNTSGAYRWTGNLNALIGSGLVLGETSANAYRGDFGKIAYDHSQLDHDYAPTVHTHEFIQSPDGLKSVTVADATFSYNNGSNNIIFANATETRFLSPDGLNSMITLTNQGAQFFDASGVRIDMNSSATVLKSPDGSHNIQVGNGGAFYDGVEIATIGDIGEGGVTDKIVSPDTNSNLTITNTNLVYSDLFSTPRLLVDNTISILTSPNWAQQFRATNTSISMKYIAVERVEVNGTTTIIRSPDQSQVLTVDNNGAFYNGIELGAGGETTNWSDNGNHVFLPVGASIGLGTSTPNSAAIHVKRNLTGGASIALRMTGGTGLTHSNIIAWYKSNDTTRRGWIGFGSSADDNKLALYNDTGDTIVGVASGGEIKLEYASIKRVWVHVNSTMLYSPNNSKNLYVSNTGTFLQGAIAVTSDERLKENMEPLDNSAIAFINGLEPISYNYRSDPGVECLGFSAQKVEALGYTNGLVKEGGEDDMKYLAYTEIIAPLVKYVQALEKRLSQLENK